MICGVSALLLLPAIAWYYVRFNAQQAFLSVAEIAVALVYVALCGLLVPCGITIIYSFFSQSRIATALGGIPSQNNSAIQDKPDDTMQLPVRREGDTPAPLVFGRDTPWGWLEHRVGRFQGLRLALTQAAVTLGREEDSDIWLDDEQAAPYHAELSWHEGIVYVTDFDTPHGVLLNGSRIKGSAILQQGALLEIGSHVFLFEYAEGPNTLEEQDDPLLLHARRNPRTPRPTSDDASPTMKLDAGQSDVSAERTTPFPSLLLRPHSRQFSGPVPLRLPSRDKEK